MVLAAVDAAICPEARAVSVAGTLSQNPVLVGVNETESSVISTTGVMFIAMFEVVTALPAPVLAIVRITEPL